MYAIQHQAILSVFNLGPRERHAELWSSGKQCYNSKHVFVGAEFIGRAWAQMISMFGSQTMGIRPPPQKDICPSPTPLRRHTPGTSAPSLAPPPSSAKLPHSLSFNNPPTPAPRTPPPLPPPSEQRKIENIHNTHQVKVPWLTEWPRPLHWIATPGPVILRGAAACRPAQLKPAENYDRQCCS